MQSPLLGYNTNVRHHGKLFHIQTEDSGSAHGHVFTHLFADGGRIIASRKGSYAAWVATERYPAIVKKLMQAQHKAMFIALRDGLFDADEAEGARVFNAQEIPLDEGVASAPASSDASPAPDALERAAAGLLASAGMPRPSSTPSASAASSSPSGAAPAVAAPPPEAPASGAGDAPRSTATRSGRYQTTRPVSVRPRPSSAPPQPEFASEVLTDKSLDELIMSYLEGDLEGLE